MSTPNKSFRVDKFSNNFTITQYLPMGETVIKSFAAGFLQYGLVKKGMRFISVPFKMFAARCLPEREYRFHINAFSDFVLHCAAHGIKRDDMEVHEHVAERGLDVDLKLETSKTPREDQVPILEYLRSPKPSMIKLVGIQPGGGKTFCAMNSICEEGRRMVAVLKNKYIEKWVSDIVELANCTKDDILVVKGSTALMDAIASASDGTLKAKAIIISGRTLLNWFTLYEEIGEKVLERGYDCTPPDLFKALKADVRLIDEVHEEFHFNFKLDMYTHVHKCISLSATLISDDQVVAKMCELAYPSHERYNQGELNKFINSHAYLYSIHRPERINSINRGTGTYSHHVFETSIMRDKKLLADYFKTIEEILDEKFVSKFIPGTRALIFCASIEMCTLLTVHLSKYYYGTDIRRYVEDDPYENIMDARICVSTLQSAGTGIDIKGLKVVIMTVAVSSTKSNIQGAGRLRYIEGMDLDFYYYVCQDIPKHLEYHDQKVKIMNERALTHENLRTGKVLGSQ